MLDIDQIRQDFPILLREVKEGMRLVYLDSAATSQKPQIVLDAMQEFYRFFNANIHRGIHTLAEEATATYEAARQKIARFIGTKNAREIIFTRNATEAINLVMYSWGRANLKAGDMIVLTEMEHHSNLIPWQILASEKEIQLEFIPVTDEGYLDLTEYERLLLLSPKLVAFTHMSNVLGTINPAAEMIQKAHQSGAITLIDGAQSVPHFPVNVRELDADFLVFSGHKMCGPTGIGVLYGRERLLEAMPPFMGGGDMIKKVSLRSYVPNELPYKFEAGTPAIAEVIGLGMAVEYLISVGMENIAQHEHTLINYAVEQLRQISGLRLLGPDASFRGGVAAFVMDYAHPHDVAQILDMDGIAVRAGHHCAMPLHEKYKIPASTRASFYLYNTHSEIDQLVKSLDRVRKIFG